jgi:hypothetical protein
VQAEMISKFKTTVIQILDCIEPANKQQFIEAISAPLNKNAVV